jgi:hypothetical protein
MIQMTWMFEKRMPGYFLQELRLGWWRRLTAAQQMLRYTAAIPTMDAAWQRRADYYAEMLAITSDNQRKAQNSPASIMQSGGIMTDMIDSYLERIKDLEAEVAALRKRLDEPAHVYDPTDWVCTYPWGDRCELQEDLIPGEIKQFATLIDGPPRFMARIVVSVDDAGDADDTEYRWFNSEDEARAALDAALGRDEDNG